MPIIGRKPSGADSGYGEMNANTMRASIMGRLSQPGWLTWMGFRAGRNTSTNATAAVAIYEADGGVIGDLVAQSVEFTVASPMQDASGGTNYQEIVTEDGSLSTSYPLKANQDYALALRAETASIAYGQDNSGHLMHFDTGSSFPDPYTANSVSAQGKMSLWAEVVTNSQPNAPVILTPAQNSTIDDTTPSIGFVFSDPDAARGDYISAYRVEIWNGANTARVSTSGIVTTDSGERSTGIVGYDTPVLTAGTYTARVTSYDHFGVASPVATRRFTVTSGGAWQGIQLIASDVAGVQGPADITNSTAPGWQATWTHPDGTHTATVYRRLIDAISGATVRSTASTTSNYAPDLLTSFGFSTPGWAALAPGPALYQVEMWAIDANGVESAHGFSRPFVINAAPTVVNVQQAREGSGRPIITVTINDANDDEAGCVVTLRIKPEGSGTGSYVDATATYVGDKQFRLVTGSGQLPSYGDYDLLVAVADPWGGSGSSAVLTIAYTAAPTLTVTNPDDEETITTGTPTIQATLDRALSQFRILISTATGTVWNSGDYINNGGGNGFSLAVPSGILHNLTDYTLAIWAQATDGLTTTSTTTFRVEYSTLAAMTGVTIATVRSSIYDVAQPEYPEHQPNVRLAWDRVSEATVPDVDWRGVVVERNDGMQWRILNRNQVTFTDTRAPGGQQSTYQVWYERTVNIDDSNASTPVSVSASVDIQHVTLTSDNPDDPAVTLHWWESSGSEPDDDTVIVPIMGQKRPASFAGVLDYEVVTSNFRVISDRSGNGYYTALDMIESVRALRGKVINYRDPWREPMRMKITSGPRRSDQHNSNQGEFTIQLTEVEG